MVKNLWYLKTSQKALRCLFDDLANTLESATRTIASDPIIQFLALEVPARHVIPKQDHWRPTDSLGILGNHSLDSDMCQWETCRLQQGLRLVSDQKYGTQQINHADEAIAL